MPPTKTKEQFVFKANKVHGLGRYGYEKVEFVKSTKPVVIWCPKCEICFEQQPRKHLSGDGCRFCYAKNRSQNSTLRSSTDEFITAAIEVHGQRYGYEAVEYINGRTKIKIKCREHGIFEQRPKNHLAGEGCRTCYWGDQKKFVECATARYGNLYEYTLVKYVNAKTPVKIVCSKHGIFEKMPDKFLREGQVCPACGVGHSKVEAEWLDFVKVPNDKAHRQVHVFVDGRRFVLDGYESETRTVFEFDGDFWHGNPSVYSSDEINQATHCSFGELYNRTCKKKQALESAGFKVVSIWESDWSKMKKELGWKTQS